MALPEALPVPAISVSVGDAVAGALGVTVTLVLCEGRGELLALVQSEERPVNEGELLALTVGVVLALPLALALALTLALEVKEAIELAVPPALEMLARGVRERVLLVLPLPFALLAVPDTVVLALLQRVAERLGEAVKLGGREGVRVALGEGVPLGGEEGVTVALGERLKVDLAVAEAEKEGRGVGGAEAQALPPVELELGLRERIGDDVSVGEAAALLVEAALGGADGLKVVLALLLPSPLRAPPPLLLLPQAEKEGSAGEAEAWALALAKGLPEVQAEA
jgi:hypothetical protein